MNLGELQAELRHFAAERDWQSFHTPKNLTTALMAEAAELAEIFQWQTPEESRLAHGDAAAKQRIGEEVADVLLYCSTPPAGRQRWTMVELERAARQEPGLGNVSRETVRRMLKKTTSSPGASWCGASGC